MAREHLYHRELFDVLRTHALGEKGWVKQLSEIHASADAAPPRFVLFFYRERKSLPSPAWAVTSCVM